MFSEGHTTDTFGLGAVNTIPMKPAYACSVHKGQGFTIKVVYAILEGLFAHGQVYVQTSRTPEELNFLCVGLPPQDLFIEIMETLWRLQNKVRTARCTWQGLQKEAATQTIDVVNNFVMDVWEQLGENDRAWAQLVAMRCTQTNYETWSLKVGNCLESLVAKYDLQQGLKRMLAVTKSFEIRGDKSKPNEKDTDSDLNPGLATGQGLAALQSQPGVSEN